MKRVIGKSLAALTCCLLPWLPVQKSAATVAQVPLFLGASISPNIMFTLDDSGSMQWELIEELKLLGGVGDDGTYYVYPPPAGTSVYGGEMFASRVPDVTENPFGMQSRSSGINKLYYNPMMTYEPWVAKDESGMMPDADPSCAPHNPYVPDLDGDGTPGNNASDCRNLEANNTESATWIAYTDADSSTTSSGSRTYWPAFYYNYNGGDRWDMGSFVKVEIKPETAPYDTGTDAEGNPNRSDCENAPTCTYAEEIQNFANWYSYFRSRILLSRFGIGRAFSRQGTKLRMGFAAINEGSNANLDGFASPGTLIKGVRQFTGTDREAIFEALYSRVIDQGFTPLRKALDDVGQYFEYTDNRGPWGKNPGTDDSTPHLSCRESYNILMTDGYWNDEAASTSGTENADDTAGLSITGPGGKAYQYTPVDPYQDGYSDTLADVAMYYWKRDLYPDLANRVPTNATDPAFWQHLVNFTVGLGVSGTLNPDDYCTQEGCEIPWPEPGDDKSEENIDDLWHAAVNSRGAFFSAKNPVRFSDRLDESLQGIIGRIGSSTSVAANSARLNADTLVFQARFNSENWSGELRAFEVDQFTGVVVEDPIWEAGELLDARALGRLILTHDAANTDGLGGPGLDFVWADLPDSFKAYLNNDPDCIADGDCVGEDRLSYLRGTRNLEEKFGGPFRTRASILADIINSNPWFAGQQDFGYNILPGDEGTSYITFRTSDPYASRPGVVYVGANGGMLHAFDAETGEELFAYVPESVFPNLWQLTDPAYTHRYFVDGPPKVGDAYIASELAWKSILVGTTGGGAKAVFALDVTDPANFNASDVLWEFGIVNDDADADSNPDGDLGYTLGQASVVRMANDKWAAVFGNGYDSVNGNAVLFIVDIEDGALIRKIDTGAGPGNGLSTPIAVDVNGDRIVDRIYGGDLLGNLWAFDVSSTNPDDWEVDYSSGGSPAPLFTAKTPENDVQPITATPQVGRHPLNGVLVYFGTGKYFELDDGALVAGDVGFKNTFYAIWDDFSATAPTPVSGDRDAGDFTALLEQEITYESETVVVDGVSQLVLTGKDGTQTTQLQPVEVRVTTENAIDWATKRGWYMDLESPVLGWESERVVTQAQLIGEIILFTTIIPSDDACDFGGTGWLMELSSKDGARLPFTPFDLNSDDYFDEDDYVDTDPDEAAENNVVVSGRKFDSGMPNQPGIIIGDDEFILVGSGSQGDDPEEERGQLTDPSGRQSWRQLR